MKCRKEGHFAQVCKEIAKKGSQVDTVEQENYFDEDCQGKSEDVHTYFGSVELGTVSDNRKRNKSLITLTQVQNPQLSPTTFTPNSLRNLYKRFTNLLKAGLQRNPYTQRAPYVFRPSTRTENWMYCTLLWKATSHHCWVVMLAWIWK